MSYLRYPVSSLLPLQFLALILRLFPVDDELYLIHLPSFFPNSKLMSVSFADLLVGHEKQPTLQVVICLCIHRARYPHFSQRFNGNASLADVLDSLLNSS